MNISNKEKSQIAAQILASIILKTDFSSISLEESSEKMTDLAIKMTNQLLAKIENDDDLIAC